MSADRNAPGDPTSSSRWTMSSNMGQAENRFSPPQYGLTSGGHTPNLPGTNTNVTLTSYPGSTVNHAYQSSGQFRSVSVLPPQDPGGQLLEVGANKKRSLTSDPSRRCVCEVCGLRFERQLDLDTHMRSHTGERPFICRFPQCGKSFSVKSNMLRHERTHTAPSQFVPANTPQSSSSYSHRSGKQAYPPYRK